MQMCPFTLTRLAFYTKTWKQHYYIGGKNVTDVILITAGLNFLDRGPAASDGKRVASAFHWRIIQPCTTFTVQLSDSPNN